MKIFLSPKAALQLTELLEYLEENWSVKTRDRFLSKFDRNLKVIVSMPKAFPMSEKKKGLRRSVISKQTTIFYRINGQEIEIVAIKNNRSNQ